MTYKIYKITSDADDGTDKFFCYIGYTSGELSTRLANHESAFRKYQEGKGRHTRSFNILQKQHYEISLIEDIEGTEEDARKAEGRCIVKFQQDPDYHVVNKRVEGRTNRQYYLDNKPKLLEYQRSYTKRLESVACQACGKTYTRCNKARHYKTHSS